MYKTRLKLGYASNDCELCFHEIIVTFAGALSVNFALSQYIDRKIN